MKTFENLSVEKKAKINKLLVKDHVKIKDKLDVHKFDTDRVKITTNPNYVDIVYNQSNNIGNLINLNVSFYIKNSNNNSLEGITSDNLIKIGQITHSRHKPVNDILTQSTHESSTSSSSNRAYGNLPLIIKTDGSIYIPEYKMESLYTATNIQNVLFNVVVTYTTGSESDTIANPLQNRGGNGNVRLGNNNQKNSKLREQNKEKKNKIMEKRISSMLKTIENSPSLKLALKKALENEVVSENVNIQGSDPETL